MTTDLNFIRQWLKRYSSAEAYWPTPPFLAEIQDAEVGLGIEFPPELYSYLLSGVFPYWLPYKNGWEWMEFDLIIRDYMGNLELFGLSSALQNAHNWQTDWLPLLSNNGGDYLCLDLNSGKLIGYRHFDGIALEVAASLTEFFADLSRDIESGLYTWTSKGEIIYSGPPLEL